MDRICNFLPSRIETLIVGVLFASTGLTLCDTTGADPLILLYPFMIIAYLLAIPGKGTLAELVAHPRGPRAFRR
ncbi:hypothetical protein [Sulfitobacter aestuariivivens]|uniref:hypothetical protein n=1 Tax=Sulfitobacter aestuariivivens TaxID=2766981 RepID=UPI0036D7EAC8